MELGRIRPATKSTMGEIGFVADRGDDRNFSEAATARAEPFIVEGGEIFGGASSAGITITSRNCAG